MLAAGLLDSGRRSFVTVTCQVLLLLSLLPQVLKNGLYGFAWCNCFILRTFAVRRNKHFELNWLLTCRVIWFYFISLEINDFECGGALLTFKIVLKMLFLDLWFQSHTLLH